MHKESDYLEQYGHGYTITVLPSPEPYHQKIIIDQAVTQVPDKINKGHFNHPDNRIIGDRYHYIAESDGANIVPGGNLDPLKIENFIKKESSDACEYLTEKQMMSDWFYLFEFNMWAGSPTIKVQNLILDRLLGKKLFIQMGTLWEMQLPHLVFSIVLVVMSFPRVP